MSNFEAKIAAEVKKIIHDDIVRANLRISGELFYVIEDSDVNFGQLVQRYGKKRVFSNLTTAYNAVTSNRMDSILMSGVSTHALAAGIAWTKSRINVYGMDGGDRLVQQGTKIETATDDATAYVIKITGTRNHFENIKWIQGSTESTALTVVQFGGEGTLVKNCSFLFGTATNLDGSETTSYEVVMGEDSGTFINCMFGSDVLVTTGARAVMAIDQVTSAQPMKGCVFKDCTWMIASTDASADFIRVIATTDCEFTNQFINSIFYCAVVNSLSVIKLDDAIRSVSGLVSGSLFFVNASSNATEFCSDVTDQVYLIGPAMNGSTPEQTMATAVTPA